MLNILIFGFLAPLLPPYLLYLTPSMIAQASKLCKNPRNVFYVSVVRAYGLDIATPTLDIYSALPLN